MSPKKIQVLQKCVIGVVLILSLQMKWIKVPQKTDSTPLFQRKHKFLSHHLNNPRLFTVKIQIEINFYVI